MDFLSAIDSYLSENYSLNKAVITRSLQQNDFKGIYDDFDWFSDFLAYYNLSIFPKNHELLVRPKAGPAADII